MTTQTIRIRPSVGTASGRRTGWIKHVVSVDTAQRNGYAYEGQFLAAGAEVDLPVGAILLSVDPTGSVKNAGLWGCIRRLEADGKLTELASGNWRTDALTLRDAAAQALKAETVPEEAPGPLAGISDDELIAECRRRNIHPSWLAEKVSSA